MWRFLLRRKFFCNEIGESIVSCVEHSVTSFLLERELLDPSSLDFILYPCGNENFFIGILFVERDKFCKYLISPGGNVISGGKLCEGDRVGNEFCILYEVCYLDW